MKDSPLISSLKKANLVSTADKSKKSRNNPTVHYIYKKTSPYLNDSSIALPNISFMTPSNDSIAIQFKTMNSVYKEKRRAWGQVIPMTAKHYERSKTLSNDPPVPKESNNMISIPGGPLVSNKVIEEWIDETLTNADEFSLSK